MQNSIFFFQCVPDLVLKRSETQDGLDSYNHIRSYCKKHLKDGSKQRLALAVFPILKGRF